MSYKPKSVVQDRMKEEGYSGARRKKFEQVTSDGSRASAPGPTRRTPRPAGQGPEISVEVHEIPDDEPGTEIQVHGREVLDDEPAMKNKRWTDLSHGERLKLTEEFLREQETNKPSKPQPTP